jgi:hypothetical protein
LHWRAARPARDRGGARRARKAACRSALVGRPAAVSPRRVAPRAAASHAWHRRRRSIKPILSPPKPSRTATALKAPIEADIQAFNSSRIAPVANRRISVQESLRLPERRIGAPNLMSQFRACLGKHARPDRAQILRSSGSGSRGVGKPDGSLRDALARAEKNLSALADLLGQWIDRVHARRPPKGVVLGPKSGNFLPITRTRARPETGNSATNNARWAVATHFAATRALRRLKGSDMVSQQDSNGNLATKFLRTFAAQTEALQCYRGKGQQKMTVEHVHVHTAGQAVVGVVDAPGGGDRSKSEEQPHAIVFAPGIEMPSPDQERSTVPSTSDARPLKQVKTRRWSAPRFETSRRRDLSR